MAKIVKFNTWTNNVIVFIKRLLQFNNLLYYSKKQANLEVFLKKYNQKETHMEIFRLIGIAIIGAICALMLKSTQSQYAILCTIATGIIIIVIVLSSLTNVILAFEDIVDKTGVDEGLFSTLLKIIGVGYLVEYSVNLCNDLDSASIGKKLALGGKITLFMMALPIVKALIDIVVGLV